MNNQDQFFSQYFDSSWLHREFCLGADRARFWEHGSIISGLLDATIHNEMCMILLGVLASLNQKTALLNIIYDKCDNYFS